MERKVQIYGDSAVLHSVIRWYGFLCVGFVNRLMEGKPHLSMSQIKDIYPEVYPTGAYGTRKINAGAWDRPIQEFRLH